MRNSRLLPYDTIVQATSGEPEAVNTVLQYYGRRIRYASRINGQADKEAEDFITETLLKALFKRHTEQEIKEKVSCFFCALRLPEPPFLHCLCRADQKIFRFIRRFEKSAVLCHEKGKRGWQNPDFSVEEI